MFVEMVADGRRLQRSSSFPPRCRSPGFNPARPGVKKAQSERARTEGEEREREREEQPAQRQIPIAEWEREKCHRRFALVATVATIVIVADEMEDYRNCYQ